MNSNNNMASNYMHGACTMSYRDHFYWHDDVTGMWRHVIDTGDTAMCNW